MAADLAVQLFELFRGLDRAHGKYTPRGGRPGEKVEGSAVTVRAPVTPDLWAGHLAGNYGLGVAPIREDSTASWGAIDVDVYVGLEHQQLAHDTERLGLPLTVARTKSGGAHLYLFMVEPVPAEVIRDKLMEWAVLLGYAGVEIFPKQVKLTKNVNDLGNWLNMPYFAGERSTRYAVKSDGRALTVAEFVDLAQARRQTLDRLNAIEPHVDAAISELLADGPPCLQSLGHRGFPRGERNNAMFNIAVYLRKRYGDEAWDEHIHDYNERFMQEPLTNKEITAIKRSVSKKTYNYKCTDQPICQACSRQICLTRRFGVGGDNHDPGVVFGDLVQIQTEPVSYIWDVDGVRLEFGDSREILDQRIFHQRIMDKIRKLPKFVPEPVWRGIISEKLVNAEVITPPADTTVSGQLYEHLVVFLTSRSQARELDELLLGRPYNNDTHSYFRIRDFLDQLKRLRGPNVNEKYIFSWLRRHGGSSGTKRLKGQLVRYWMVPKPDVQTEEFDVPTAEVRELDQ